MATTKKQAERTAARPAARTPLSPPSRPAQPAAIEPLKQVSIRIPGKLWRRVKVAAAEGGVTVQGLVEQLIKAAVGSGGR